MPVAELPFMSSPFRFTKNMLFGLPVIFIVPCAVSPL